MLPIADSEAKSLILLFIAKVLIAFGIVVVVLTLIFKLKKKSCKNLWVRYAAFFIMAPVIFLPLAYSKTLFQIIIFLLSLGGFWEFARATGLKASLRLPILFAIALIYYPIFISWYGLYQATPGFAIVLILLFPILRDQYKNVVHFAALSALSVLYFGWFFSHLAFLRNYNTGIMYIGFFFFLIVANDAFAYIAGNIFGKHPLSPNLSPNKTKEGAVGAFLLTNCAAFISWRYLIPHFTWWQVLCAGSILSLGGICGDLTMSAIKRDIGIKDMGSLIPGHGGLLDRMNSMLFTAPLYFHFVRYYFLG